MIVLLERGGLGLLQGQQVDQWTEFYREAEFGQLEWQGKGGDVCNESGFIKTKLVGLCCVLKVF